MTTTVNVIHQHFIAEFAEKYSNPSKLTLSIQFEATMLSHSPFDDKNRIDLLRKIRDEIEHLINEVAEAPKAEVCWEEQ